jgi:hypothetical protein
MAAAGIERDREVFVPALTTIDEISIIAWSIGYVVLLALTVSSRPIPIPDPPADPSTSIVPPHELLLWLEPIGLAAVAAGVVGGSLLRLRGRWYELPIGALTIGWSGAYAVFAVWFMQHQSPPHRCTSANPCDSGMALMIGAGLAAVPEMLILLLAALVARGSVLALGWAGRSLRPSR